LIPPGSPGLREASSNLSPVDIMRCVLLLTLLLLILIGFRNPLLGDVRGTDYRSWVDVNVLSFDGESITAKINIVATGNHENATVRIYGEILGSNDQSQPCPLGSICVSSSVTGIVGRAFREVTYSTDLNLTTFEYIAKWASTYKVANQILGLPIFPFDEHELTLKISSDFNIDMDGHTRIPSLPTSNYEGSFQVTSLNPPDLGPFEYQLDMRVDHPFLFQCSMAIWTWGVVSFLVLATGGLLFALRKPNVSRENVVTAASSFVVFVPVYELALQTFKAPLGMTFPDAVIFALLVIDAMTLTLAILWKTNSYKMNRRSNAAIKHRRKAVTRA
jgi:hypothetical protein